MSAARKTPAKARQAAGKAPAKSGIAQLNIKVPATFKTAIAGDAKKAGRTIAAEVLHRCTVKERLRADLAAGRVPVVDAVADVPAAAPAISAPAQVATSASYAPPEMVDEAFRLVHDIYEAVTEDHTDTQIPNRLGQRAKAFTIRYPRAEA